MIKIKFSRGNTKIGKNKDTIIFNMDSAHNCYCRLNNICEHKTICYALKSEKMYKNVLKYRTEQFKAWKSESIDKITDDIRNITNKNLKISIKYVRFNESGDFNSQLDVNKLIKLANNNKDLIFYGFTHRYDLNYSNIPNNLIINGSEFMLDNEFKVINKSESDKYQNICKGYCYDCNLCKTKNKKVIAVIKH